MELLLVRHAQPVRERQVEGGSDPGLHDRGRRQSEFLASYLGEEGIDALYVSSMRRAVETARFVSDATGLPAVVDDALVEFDHGASEYVPVEEMRESGDDRYAKALAGDVSAWDFDVDAFRARVVGAVERIVVANPGRKVAVVCHGGVINAYLGHVLGIERLVFFLPEYTSIHRVMAARTGVRTIATVNEAAHLRGHRIPAPTATPASVVVGPRVTNTLVQDQT